MAFPNRKKLSTFDSEGIETGALDVEKKMRDQCEKILLKGGSTTSTKQTKYTAWQPSNHSHTKDPYRYLDEIFTDESVDAIMMAYYFDRDFDRREVYETLIAKDINGFYSRSNSTRKYSNWVVLYRARPKCGRNLRLVRTSALFVEAAGDYHLSIL